MKPDLWSEQLEEGDCMGAGASCSEHGCPSGAEMLEVLSGGQILGESLTTGLPGKSPSPLSLGEVVLLERIGCEDLGKDWGKAVEAGGQGDWMRRLWGEKTGVCRSV